MLARSSAWCAGLMLSPCQCRTGRTVRQDKPIQCLLRSEYCLCQRVKPVSDPKTPFSSEAEPHSAGRVFELLETACVQADFIAALQCHHQASALQTAVHEFS